MKSYYFISSFFVILLFICLTFLLEIEKPKHQFDWTEIRSTIKDTVLALEEFNVVSSRLVNESATISPQYDRAKWFMENARAYELHQLINYNNGCVKAYSFKALLKKRDTNIFDYIVNSYNSKTMIYSQSGCIGQEFSLFEYYAMQITPPFQKETIQYVPKFNNLQVEKLNKLIDSYNSNTENLFHLVHLQLIQ